MALLIDGGWSTAEDLQPYDGGATTAAAEEGIDLQAKLRLSEAWITDEVEEFLRWEGGARSLYAAGPLAARNAVVDGRLKRWHLTNVLSMLYRDASFSQANDRYQQKYQAYARDAATRRMEISSTACRMCTTRCGAARADGRGGGGGAGRGGIRNRGDADRRAGAGERGARD